MTDSRDRLQWCCVIAGVAVSASQLAGLESSIEVPRGLSAAIDWSSLKPQDGLVPPAPSANKGTAETALLGNEDHE